VPGGDAAGCRRIGAAQPNSELFAAPCKEGFPAIHFPKFTSAHDNAGVEIHREINMRKLKIEAELSTRQHEALVFFALSLDEQLYDMTDDSFKAPALNTYSRTFELQAVASANHSAGISKDAHNPFIDELEWSL
jgi:hypothetical protein